MRLHTIYLINDVLYHANSRDNRWSCNPFTELKKKTFRTILTAFEEIIVPLWSITKLRADKEIGERLIKLKKLWTDNKYFSTEVEERFNMHIVEYKQVLFIRIRWSLRIFSFAMALEQSMIKKSNKLKKSSIVNSRASKNSIPST